MTKILNDFADLLSELSERRKDGKIIYDETKSKQFNRARARAYIRVTLFKFNPDFPLTGFYILVRTGEAYEGDPNDFRDVELIKERGDAAAIRLAIMRFDSLSDALPNMIASAKRRIEKQGS